MMLSAACQAFISRAAGERTGESERAGERVRGDGDRAAGDRGGGPGDAARRRAGEIEIGAPGDIRIRMPPPSTAVPTALGDWVVGLVAIIGGCCC
jgi:hypothetical protein